MHRLPARRCHSRVQQERRSASAESSTALAGSKDVAIGPTVDLKTMFDAQMCQMRVHIPMLLQLGQGCALQKQGVNGSVSIPSVPQPVRPTPGLTCTLLSGPIHQFVGSGICLIKGAPKAQGKEQIAKPDEAPVPQRSFEVDWLNTNVDLQSLCTQGQPAPLRHDDRIRAPQARGGPPDVRPTCQGLNLSDADLVATIHP